MSASADRPILIVGGGIAGTAAALHVAAAGRRALLVEDAPALGGAQILLDKTFPTDSCGLCFMAPETPALCPFLECEAEPRIEIQHVDAALRAAGCAGSVLGHADHELAPG